MTYIVSEEFFRDCQKTEETFDDCVKDGLNILTPYFKTGLPNYNITAFDPFFAAEVAQKRSGPFYSYKLILRNVSEYGWSSSHITKLKTDVNRHLIQYTQFFPDKGLDGFYEIEGTFFGNKISNSGAWNLKLYDYIQTTTITRKPQRDVNGGLIPHPPLKVEINAKSSRKLELHIENLAGGRTILENMLDWIINRAWQPGFVILTPLIDDLVSTAFTGIFNKNLQYFPFEKIFPN
ncbi:hypothetical protein Zmor_014047 [Zophobas morio]|uniref:Uncharacterized protein n=1 Tax=Zophobas morio TaxID=2755281 RepID=A0AA38MG39_9CUCU|nr:hypothetical protein Zmor_014047 [Zophobas morio]